jgi:extracellular factor (EF) 3-hydroxypalmitic acid methyl ester biosynthesis protein
VLSVACGHLREAQCADAVHDGAIAAFYALDQDPISIALLRAQHAPLGVTPTLGSVRDVLAGRAAFPGLTLAYAAGLYDYLPTPVAARLTARMFDMLAPGGRLIVANFCPELRDVGMLESFMAWNLIYRDEAGMREVAAELPADRVASQRMFRDPGGNVVYLEVERG